MKCVECNEKAHYVFEGNSYCEKHFWEKTPDWKRPACKEVDNLSVSRTELLKELAKELDEEKDEDKKECSLCHEKRVLNPLTNTCCICYTAIAYHNNKYWKKGGLND